MFLAERKFSYVKEFKLRKHIEFANRVVHDYGRVEGNEEDIVRDFLETAKTLIEKAPKRTTT